jgi:hypothetical protein
VLGIRETAHTDLATLDYDYDFRVLDSPGEVRRLIEERNDANGGDGGAGRARMVAGYCWDWSSKSDPEAPPGSCGQPRWGCDGRSYAARLRHIQTFRAEPRAQIV